ncbi:MAG TPA: hypothetical protein DDW33_10135 [Ktedonobacter sp.]|nr:hypothetical protein [Ktedonobacter sp.]HAT46937.1 hypothetical protein [Ktedonobacter sp.]HBE26034.1 hypothetical protein [Ktedonobacter sp.]HCF84590.1 hypothetical protein [Ktedonobacter sp.]
MVATRPETNTIAIARTFDGIEEAAHRVIEQVGGMASVLKGAKIAILKPNFVAGRGAETGSTTSFALLKAVAEEVQACGAEPVLCEMPGTEFDREATYTILGVEQFCQERGIRILRIDPEGNEQDWVPVQPAGAKKLRRFHVPRILNEACLINLPVLKTHVVSTMTLGMKNPMGILPRPDRRSMHTFGIDQSIVDMNLGIKPDLTIIDGSVGQDGEGPLYGDRADLQVLVAGHDSLAVDLVCCQLVGVKPRDIPHLKLALEQVGKPSWTLAGEDVGVIKQFRLPEVKPLYRFVFWMMYPLDYPFTWISERGKHLCTTLYSTGLVGTRPQIKEENCTRCGVCVEACPLPNVIDLKSLKVNYATCQRCLLCYEACPENAISVKGYSGARQ